MDAIKAVPKETLTTYSAAICHPKLQSQSKHNHKILFKQSQFTFPFSTKGSNFILNDFAASLDR